MRWLAIVSRQLKIRTEAGAREVSASLERYAPVWIASMVTHTRQVQSVLRQALSDHHALARYAAHLGVLVMVLAALPISQIELSRAVDAAPPEARDVLEQGRMFLVAWTQPVSGDDGFLTHAIVPHTTRAEPEIPALDVVDPNEEFAPHDSRLPSIAVIRPRDSIISYTVQPGDTVFDIADRFDVSADTVLWANPNLEKRPDLLSIGQEVEILPVSGVYHIVAKGETLDSIAKKYKADPAAIVALALNNLQPDGALTPGQKIVVPGGEKPEAPKPVMVAKAGTTTKQPSTAAKVAANTQTSGARVSANYNAPVPPDAAKGAGTFVWPVGGRITQRFSRGHPGVDIATKTGTPIAAGDAGYVVYAGWSTVGYGNMVLIDHGNGFRTLYGHMSQILVQTGQSIAKGDLIGKIGCTGRCTGPHLHLEIIENGVKRNPFSYLP